MTENEKQLTPEKLEELARSLKLETGMLPVFICRHDSFRFLDDDFDLDVDHYPLVQALERKGFVKVPDWMPVGLPGYAWEYPNYIEAMMRPKPKWRHWFRYKLVGFFGRWHFRRHESDWLKAEGRSKA